MPICCPLHCQVAALGGVVATPPREDEGAHPAAPAAAPSSGEADMTSVATRQRHAGSLLLGCPVETQSCLLSQQARHLKPVAFRCYNNAKN